MRKTANFSGNDFVKSRLQAALYYNRKKNLLRRVDEEPVDPTQDAPQIVVSPFFTPEEGTVGTRFVLDLGIATGIPSPDLDYSIQFNGEDVVLDGTSGYTPEEAGTLSVSVTWSNGILPNASQTVEVTVLE